MVSRAQLVVGAYRHPICEDCDERRNKTYLDSQTRWIVRTRFCGEILVDFSVLLQVELPMGWTDVTRYSVAHSNFHQYLPGDRRHEFGPIDSPHDVDRAYNVALLQGFDETVFWLAEWRRLT